MTFLQFIGAAMILAPGAYWIYSDARQFGWTKTVIILGSIVAFMAYMGAAVWLLVAGGQP